MNNVIKHFLIVIYIIHINIYIYKFIQVIWIRANIQWNFYGINFQLNVLGHQFVAQQYYTVIICNNCHQNLFGISPQGYQCSACLINLHRHCVKQFEDSCPGPIMKKDSNSRGIMKLIGMRHDSNDHNKMSRRSNQFLQSKLFFWLLRFLLSYLLKE